MNIGGCRRVAETVGPRGALLTAAPSSPFVGHRTKAVTSETRCGSVITLAPTTPGAEKKLVHPGPDGGAGPSMVRARMSHEQGRVPSTGRARGLGRRLPPRFDLRSLIMHRRAHPFAGHIEKLVSKLRIFGQPGEPDAFRSPVDRSRSRCASDPSTVREAVPQGAQERLPRCRSDRGSSAAKRP